LSSDLCPFGLFVSRSDSSFFLSCLIGENAGGAEERRDREPERGFVIIPDILVPHARAVHQR